MRTLCPASRRSLLSARLPFDAQLAFADDALDVGKRQARKPRFEEAVDPHVVLVRRDDHGLNLGRQRLGFHRVSGSGGLRCGRGTLFWLLVAALVEDARRLAARPVARGALGLRAIVVAKFRRGAACVLAAVIPGHGPLDASAHGAWLAQKEEIVTAKSLRMDRWIGHIRQNGQGMCMECARTVRYSPARSRRSFAQ